jgi:hypothetical protein
MKLTLYLAFSTLSFLFTGVSNAIASDHYVDGVSGATAPNLSQKAVHLTLPSAGTYTLRLANSDFRENFGTPNPQRHVIVSGNSFLGDKRVFTLNGNGDTETITHSGELLLFFLDDLIEDNTGGSTVELWSNGALLQTVYVDAIVNTIPPPTGAGDVRAPIPLNSSWQISLIDADFRENFGTPNPQRHVVVLGGSGLGDMRTFTLNGLNDSRTIEYGPNEVRLLFIDDVVWDNTGGATVRVTRVLPPLTAQVASVAIQWKTIQGEKYQLQYATALSPNTWTDIGNVIVGTGVTTQHIDTVLGTTQRFYRLAFVP